MLCVNFRTQGLWAEGFFSLKNILGKVGAFRNSTGSHSAWCESEVTSSASHCLHPPAAPCCLLLRCRSLVNRSWAHYWKESRGCQLRNHQDPDTEGTGMAEDQISTSAGGEQGMLTAFPPLQVSHSIPMGSLQMGWLFLSKWKALLWAQGQTWRSRRSRCCRALSQVKSSLHSSPCGHEDRDLFLVLRWCLELLSQALSHWAHQTSVQNPD